jgi:hypothetical protein
MDAQHIEMNIRTFTRELKQIKKGKRELLAIGSAMDMTSPICAVEVRFVEYASLIGENLSEHEIPIDLGDLDF